MDNKKIVLLFSSLKNGGGRTFAISIVKQISNCEIILSTLRDKQETKELADDLGVKVTYIFNPRILFNPNCIIISNSQITSALCAIIFPFRHIYVTHGFANGLNFTSIIRKFIWVIQVNIPGTKLIGCGQTEFNKIQRLTNRFIKCYLIKNCVPPNIFSKHLKVNLSNKSNRHHRLCYIGRICHQKGLDIFIDALSTCSTYFELTVVGDMQPNEPYFCKMIREKLNKLKCQTKIISSQNITIELLNQFDICVSPSRFEGLPYLLLELAHYGMPLMVSDCPGNSDIIPCEQYGFVFKSDDTESLNESLNRFIAASNEEINLRVLALQNLITEEYDPQNFGNAYRAIFNA